MPRSPKLASKSELTPRNHYHSLDPTHGFVEATQVSALHVFCIIGNPEDRSEKPQVFNTPMHDCFPGRLFRMHVSNKLEVL